MNASMIKRLVAAAAAAVTAFGLATGTAAATAPGHDGKLAFNRAGDIYTVNLNGTGLRRLTTSGGGNGWPNWSPDGSKIAWVHKGSIWTMNADGSGKKAFATGTSPSWSPDGTRIAFVGLDKSDQKSCGDVPVVFTKPASGGTRTVIEASNYGAYCSWGSQYFTWGNTTAWYGTHVGYGYTMWDGFCDPYCNSYGFADNPAATKTGYGTLVVQKDSGDSQLPAPDVDTSPSRPNVVWTGKGGVHVTRIDGTFHKTVVTDAHAYAPKYDPANTAIFYTTKTSSGTYVISRVGLAAGSIPRTVLTNASQPDVQPIS